jgi:transmembrane sensor
MSISEHQFRQLLDRYLQGKASPEEISILDQFFDSYTKEHPGDIAGDNSLHSKEEILSAIHQRLQMNSDARSTVAFRWWKVAATISVIAMAFIIFYNTTSESQKDVSAVEALTTEQTHRGEKSTIELPDGTMVHLNSNSQVTFSQQFKGETREVNLIGEAYFVVSHDVAKPFIVITKNTTTKVLGTTFNIRAHHNKDIEITLVDGKINVGSSNGGQATLAPGQQAVISVDTQLINTKNVDVNQYIGWKDNILFFNRVTLVDAAERLGEWYDVNIDIKSPAIRNCMITGTYKNESLDNVLKSIQFLLGAKTDRLNEKNIVITGKGCK